ncbi:hypothetical protein RS130_01095 [Paraglaciecola aquimarina]|uniref:DUF2946 domain-containing protein n=1 Tax=Paraglaciecola aquimarina TaxID=1235557 RepID=A0ABU3SRT3_9ALTE|nr:hypothetical protein [Paraglaciecola aquimarina]MDU0352695.1 hypothetical protein [Paraglaciecola aquimarina]
MITPISRVLVVGAILIAFVGQVLAYSAMSCEMSSSSHESHMNMGQAKTHHHEGMDHGEMNKINNGQTEDCCDVDCVCPANACSSTIVLNSSVDLTDIQLLSEPVAELQSKQPYSISTSLYRPPIFA